MACIDGTFGTFGTCGILDGGIEVEVGIEVGIEVGMGVGIEEGAVVIVPADVAGRGGGVGAENGVSCGGTGVPALEMMPDGILDTVSGSSGSVSGAPPAAAAVAFLYRRNREKRSIVVVVSSGEVEVR